MTIGRSTSALVVLLLVGAWVSRPALVQYFSAAEQTPAVQEGSPTFVSLASGWRAEPQRVMPEPVACLLPVADRAAEHVYVGTSNDGGVYRFDADLPQTYMTIASFLGDMSPGGHCVVSNLALTDLDGDRTLELLAHTNQVHPRGQPKLCVWSLDPIPKLRAIARPAIESSWNHGLAITNLPHMAHRSVLSTYCGHGELVVYYLLTSKMPNGFSAESLAWRQVGKLPTSGEQVLRADADNDGRDDVAIATGFQHHEAALRIYTRTGKSVTGPDDVFVFGAQNWRLTHVLDEERRFGNVRFTIGRRTSAGDNEVFAWWCTDLAGGECELIRYVLGPNGLRHREQILAGPAHEYWPLEWQIARADLTGDGVAELWFATGSGRLWCYDVSTSPLVREIASVKEGLGPIAAGIERRGKPRRLYLASGRHVLALQSTRPPVLSTIASSEK